MGHFTRLQGRRVTWRVPPPPDSGIIFGAAKVYLEEDPKKIGTLVVTEIHQDGPNTYFLGYDGHGFTVVDYRSNPVKAAWDVIKRNYPEKGFIDAFSTPADFGLEYEGNRVTKLTLYEHFPADQDLEKTLLLAIIPGYTYLPVDWEFYGPAESKPSFERRVWNRLIGTETLHAYAALVSDK